MDDKLPNSDDITDWGEISSSTPPREALGMFSAELKYFINSIDGCAQMLLLNPNDELRHRALEIISGNLDRMKNLQKVVNVYLDRQIDED